MTISLKKQIYKTSPKYSTLSTVQVLKKTTHTEKATILLTHFGGLFFLELILLSSEIHKPYASICTQIHLPHMLKARL
jgi:hypothetical protein